MTETKLIGRLAMMRPILTLKNPVVQAKPRVAQDHPNNPEEEQREEQAQEADNKASTAGAPPPPLMIKLCEQFPKTFRMTDRKPVKVGIHKDILAIMTGEGILSAFALRQALQWYTRGINYHLAILEQTHRLDLKGNAVEEITPAQKARAALAIETIQSLRKKKRFVFKPKKQG